MKRRQANWWKQRSGRESSAKRCDAQKKQRQHNRHTVHPVLAGLSKRQTKLLRRLDQGWTLATGLTCQLMRGSVRGAIVRWKDIGFLVQAGLLSIKNGLKALARDLLHPPKSEHDFAIRSLVNAAAKLPERRAYASQ